ncbi:MAG: hypothetical protein KDG55_02455 [Rhodocyclaceae bacterium]|nr:hypothetical protein [Rhodocyclaceae bacterium]
MLDATRGRQCGAGLDWAEPFTLRDIDCPAALARLLAEWPALAAEPARP